MKIIVVGNALAGLSWIYEIDRRYSISKNMQISVYGKPFKPVCYQPLISKEILNFFSSLKVKKIELQRLQIGYWDGVKLLDTKKGKFLYKEKFPADADKELRASKVVENDSEYWMTTPLEPIIELYRTKLKKAGVEFYDILFETTEQFFHVFENCDVCVWATAIQPLLKFIGMKELLSTVESALIPIEIGSCPARPIQLFENYDYVYDVNSASPFYRYWIQYKQAEARVGTYNKKTERVIIGWKIKRELNLQPFIFRGRKIIPFSRGGRIAQIIWRDAFTADDQYFDLNI